MKKRRIIRLTALLVIFALLLCGCSKPAPADREKETTAEDTTETTAAPEPAAVNSAEDAVQELSSHSAEYGYENALSELTVKSETAVDGDRYYRLQQNYQGIPVYGRSAVYAADSAGQQLAVTGNITDIDSTLSLTPALSAEEAAAAYTALAEADAASSDFLIPPTDDDVCVYNLNGHADCLAYVFTVIMDDIPFECLIDAQTGELLLRNPCLASYEGKTVTCTGKDIDKKKVEFNAFQRSGEDHYELYDELRNIVVYDACGETVYYGISFTSQEEKYHSSRKDEKTVFIWERNNAEVDGDGLIIDEGSIGWYLTTKESDTNLQISTSTSTDWKDKVAVTAMNRTETIYDYYDQVLHRHGFDNKNSKMYTVINDLGAKENTAVSHNGNGLTLIAYYEKMSRKIMAHEYTHSVEKSICDLMLSGESGTIAEGIADIFGELIEAWPNGKADWVCDDRNPKNPASSGNPEIYKTDLNWDASFSDVHQNATVLSHAAYLMSSKLTDEQLAKLWYRAMLMMPSDCDFITCRHMVELAAQSSVLFSDEQRACVQAAFDEVGIVDDFAVKNDFAISVLASDAKPYDNYSCHISGWTTDTESESDLLRYENTFSVFDDSPQSISLKEGFYKLTIRNNVGAPDPKTVTLRVFDGAADTEVTIATNYLRKNEPFLTVDWLTGQLFYADFQCPTAMRFNPDGTFKEVYVDPPTKEVLSNEICNSGIYSISGDTVTLVYDRGFVRTLTCLSPADHPDCENEDRYCEAARLIDEDEHFLYEVGYVQEYDETGMPYDDAAIYLVPGVLQDISMLAKPCYSAYLPYIRAACDSAGYHATQDSAGLFYDLNADGTEELLLRYTTTTEEVHCAAYTIVDGVAQLIAENKAVQPNEIQAIDIGLVSFNGTPVLYLRGGYELASYVGSNIDEWYLYDCSGPDFEQIEAVKAEMIMTGSFIGTRNGEDMSWDEYNAFSESLEILQSVEYEKINTVTGLYDLNQILNLCEAAGN